MNGGRHVLTGPPDLAMGAPGPGEAEPSDAELIERSRTDPGCFASIFDRHAGEILRYAHARLGPELAEDVTAETFLAAFRHRDRYDTTRPDARPWLYGIAVRQIGRHRRAQSRQLRLLRSAPLDLVTEDFSPGSTERVAAEQLRPRLAAVLPDQDQDPPGAGRGQPGAGSRGDRPWMRSRCTPRCARSRPATLASSPGQPASA